MESTESSYALSAERRIKRSSDFLLILKSKGPDVLRLCNHWFELKVRKTTAVAGVRFGFTVGKVNAKRSVDRVLIKRILRESARNRIPVFSVLCRNENMGIDISLRLKRKFPKIDGNTSLDAVKKDMRSAVDSLLLKLEKVVVKRFKENL
ncbi:MAG: ribonuclease P protein component [Burkholderiaceae bacterium]|nr:ribonuclease P protein component [Burkholderiaceae bacterium]